MPWEKITAPVWAQALVVASALAAAYAFGRMDGDRIAGEFHLDYITRQADRTVLIGRAQSAVVVKTEIQYRDRIQKIYLKGAEIEKQVMVYVTPADDDRGGVNVGFVRVFNAAWSGQAPGPAEDADREPAGISLADVAAADAANATSCRAWREQALGLREFYEGLKEATNK